MSMSVNLPYRAPAEDNPYWPLPPDYEDLSSEEQKVYRLAVCKTQETVDDFLVAFFFFESYYLVEYGGVEKEGGYRVPFFKDFVPNAPFHIEVLRDWFTFPRNILGAPRGSAKSVKFGTELPLFLIVTRPNYHVALCQATDRMIGRRVEKIRQQISDNERIVQDWGVLKPVRGRGLWSGHQLSLRNGSSLEGFSVKGRKRGERPDFFLFDDPEYDPDRETDTAALRENLDRVVFKQIIPMLRPGCKFMWLGTTINRRSLLYHALQGTDTRFEHFNRRRVKAYEELEDGSVLLAWEAMWTYEYLLELKHIMGPAHFSAEYQNEPIAEEDRLFHIHELYDTYEIDGPIEPTPWECRNKIRFYRLPRIGRLTEEDKPELVEMPFEEFLKKYIHTLIMCVDYAPTISPTSDFSDIAIQGFSADLNMWALFNWHGKVSDNQLVNLIWKFGSEWRPRVVACEHRSILDLLETRMAEFVARGLDTGWRPRPFLLKYTGRGAPDKGERISGEEWRFSTHLIKLPLYRRREKMWAPFFSQVEGFTRNLDLLEHDDAIDAQLGMPRFVIKVSPKTHHPPKVKTIEDYHKAGQLQDEYGFPLIPDLQTANLEDIQRGLDVQYGRVHNKKRRRKVRINRVAGRRKTPGFRRRPK